MLKLLVILITSVAAQQHGTLRGNHVNPVEINAKMIGNKDQVDSQQVAKAVEQFRNNVRKMSMGSGMGMSAQNGGGPIDSILGAIGDALDGLGLGKLDCPLSAATEGESCSGDLVGGEGVWVCRNITNQFQSTVCIDQNFTMSAIDTCGCCGGICPKACNCPCNLMNSSGVRVTYDLTPLGVPLQFDECMDPTLALSVVGLSDGITCVTNCSMPANPPFPVMGFPTNLP